MDRKYRTIIAAVLIVLTVAPPVVHVVFGGAIKAHRERAADKALRDLETAAESAQ